MRIRSITYFMNPGFPIQPERFKQAGLFALAAGDAFQQAGFEVQTLRLATVPFPQLISNASQALKAACQMEIAAKEHGFSYIGMGPAQITQSWSYSIISDILAGTQDLFLAAEITHPETGISLKAVRACGKIMQQISTITPDGFTNLRFTALANVLPGSPFFPAAYHRGDSPAFALATEAADLAVSAFQSANTLDEARKRLASSITENVLKLDQISHQLEQQRQTHFYGIDFSLAPFPETEHSIGKAMEAMGIPAVGLSGSVAAAAILTDTLERTRFAGESSPKQTGYTSIGFNGLMYPVLEDNILARRAAEGSLTINDLLLYSAVCGTGLDTIPLPGDIEPEQISAILLDVAALALRLDKPLTARLMPIPGKQAGDVTNFDFAYFANSQVMAPPAQPLTAFFAGDEDISILPRQAH